MHARYPKSPHNLPNSIACRKLLEGILGCSEEGSYLTQKPIHILRQETYNAVSVSVKNLAEPCISRCHVLTYLKPFKNLFEWHTFNYRQFQSCRGNTSVLGGLFESFCELGNAAR